MSETALLSAQAAELARKLPPSNVSATEWYSIGEALKITYHYEEARESLGYALESSKGFNEKIAILRASADLLFRMSDIQGGRDKYQKALSIFSEYNGYDDYTKNSTHILTYIDWAYSESAAQFRSEANECLTKAKSYFDKLPANPANKIWEDRIDDARKRINSVAELTARSRTANDDAAVPVVSGTKPPTAFKGQLKPRKSPTGPTPKYKPRQPKSRKRNVPRQSVRRRRH